MRLEFRNLMALLVLFAFSLVTACKKESVEPPLPPLAEPLPAWNGAITDLAPDDTIGWVFANVASLREQDVFDGFLDEMAPRADDALALAVVDASQVFVAWTSYADASRLSVVRTRVSATDLIESIRNEATVEGLTESVGPEGLPLWVDESGWALAAPADNLVFAGPRRDVEQGALKLLDESLSEDDILANAQGITFSMEVSSEMRAALLGGIDSPMVVRAFEPVQQVEGRITIDGPLELNGQVLLSPRGNPALLATFMKVGWSRLAPEALSDWFRPEYAERVASGFDASASDGPRNAVDIQFILPEQDTRLWLDALASADFDDPSETIVPSGSAAESADELESSDNAVEATELEVADPDAAEPAEAEVADEAETEPTERQPASPPTDSRSTNSRPRTDPAPLEDAPTTLPP